MPATGCRAGDFDSHMFDVFSRAGELIGQVRAAVAGMSGSHGPGPGARSRSGGFGRPDGPEEWPGGFSAPRGHWWPGPLGPPRGPKANRGDVRAAILALLREGPRTGYQIMSEIEERSGGAWRPSPGSVYPALAQLADEGLIIGAESGGRRAFSLTDAGRDYLQDNPGTARGTWEPSTPRGPGEVPALLAHAARLGGGIAQMAHAGTPGQVRAAGQLLDQTRRSLYRILADDNDSADDTSDGTGPGDAAGAQGE